MKRSVSLLNTLRATVLATSLAMVQVHVVGQALPAPYQLPPDGTLVADLASDFVNGMTKKLAPPANPPPEGQPISPAKAAPPLAAGQRQGGVMGYGGKARLPGESIDDCNKRLGNAKTNGHVSKNKSVREKCGYVGVDGVY